MQQSNNRYKKTAKPYKRPTLTVFGNIRELTLNVGNMGLADGGASPMHKTSA